MEMIGKKRRRRRKGANMKRLKMKNFLILNITKMTLVAWVASGLLIGSGNKAVIATFVASSVWLSVFFTVNQF